MKKISILLAVSIIGVSQACTQQSKEKSEKNLLKLSDNFGDYWYRGEAELASYELEQVRYGEIRKGTAVLVFVTEDFSKTKQVKLDNPSAHPEDAQKVLKLNFTKKFLTGIYPYSIMTSSFSPVYPKEDVHAVKVTTSAQEWCGHVFMQLNKKANDYQLLVRSYFESRGDQFLNLEKTWLEDELWTLLRLDPASIPTGEVNIIPSTEYMRLKHIPIKTYKGEIAKSSADNLSVLTLRIPELERTLNIHYTPEHPYKIEKWDETFPEAGEMMTTSGRLKERIMLDYWNKNSVADTVYRQQLDLE